MTTFAEQINTLATRIGAECKTLREEIQQASVGGSAENITYGDGTVADALDDLLYKAIAIESFTCSVGTQEMGATVTDVTLKWKTNKEPKTLMLDSESLTVTDTQKVLSGQSITTNKTWTLKATDDRDATAQKSVSIQFLNGIYYGKGMVTDTSGVTNEFVLGLTKKLQGGRAGTWVVNAGAGEYIYFAQPTSMGTPTFTVGGFDGGFIKLHTFEFTNSQGHTESYDVWKSENANLGNTTVVVK